MLGRGLVAGFFEDLSDAQIEDVLSRCTDL
jgi:hypothetical protein